MIQGKGENKLSRVVTHLYQDWKSNPRLFNTRPIAPAPQATAATETHLVGQFFSFGRSIFHQHSLVSSKYQATSTFKQCKTYNSCLLCLLNHTTWTMSKCTMTCWTVLYNMQFKNDICAIYKFHNIRKPENIQANSHLHVGVCIKHFYIPITPLQWLFHVLSYTLFKISRKVNQQLFPAISNQNWHCTSIPSGQKQLIPTVNMINASWAVTTHTLILCNTIRAHTLTRDSSKLLHKNTHTRWYQKWPSNHSYSIYPWNTTLIN